MVIISRDDLLKYTAHLLRCHANSNPQRIIDTPAVGICVAPCICAVYFKRLTEGGKKNKANALIDPDVFYKCGKVLLSFVYLLNCCGYIGL